ncbi:MAG: hypothetical protein KAI16_01985 [Candidatus Pacebacteria bacterium]|nr:hypothetical protein [Candidatus Paceibacterota bacterium]
MVCDFDVFSAIFDFDYLSFLYFLETLLYIYKKFLKLNKEQGNDEKNYEMYKYTLNIFLK